MLKTLVVAAAVLAVGFAKCPDIPALQEFDATQYVGHWYEIAKYPFASQADSCEQANYTLRADGSIRVENRGMLSNGTLDRATGVATVPDPARPAELVVKFDKGGGGRYNVIRTDYAGSALVYSCEEAEDRDVEFAWFLSRESEMDERVQEEYTKILADAGSDVSKLIVTLQDCGDLFQK